MNPRRFLVAPTLALALWMIYDGARCLLTGTYTARMLQENDLATAQGVIVRLEDGRLVEYGLWAWPFTLMNMDPAALAPFFVAWGALGLLGLVLYFLRKPAGWMMLFTFAVAGLAYLIPGTIVAAVLLIVLMLPPIRAYVFAPLVEVAGDIASED